ncbi:hypothetical protein IL54_4641 [Sphingobium sp. ba1]|jgi:hypothetical protein|uniref:hypothetical protein n=1 Tax=Sphingobium sp. ba1 TaxID=1522072 RepID=UPI000569CB86|nr:hypothetical protein [Sphingobium sp. ba1]KGA95331.1 hypothetical protein IL54_4641 [Sphingobium sp. ba1]
MSAQSNIKRVSLWIASQALPAFILASFFYALGYRNGHSEGRIEMKCAILAVVERLGEATPAPGTITLGCDTRPARTHEAGSAAA